ncbi:MAG: DUF3782 domain-containing protein [Cytophagales bacterium]|nr:DUF3782 domain-containing protein [Cytophagales bacterium]
MMKSTASQSPLTFEKVWQMFQETDKKFQETDKEISKLAGLFTTQWGKLVEALVKPGTLELFKKRGIKVNQFSTNTLSHRKGETMEIDVLLVNDTEVVVGEVKTTAKVSDVKHLIECLKNFKKFFSQYKKYTVYGAIAGLRLDEQCDRYAASQGLFVVEFTGKGLARIKNKKNFIAKKF